MNLPTIIAAALVAAALIAIIARSIKNKKNGKSACGSGCGGCAMKDHCTK